MTRRIECPTCGGSGHLPVKPGGGNTFSANYPCPDCIRGRTASPEVLARMKKAMHDEYAIGKPRSYADWDRFVLAAWLADHGEDEDV